jgi:hypothetical protein
MGVFDEQLRQLMEEDPKPDRTDPASGSHAVSRVTFRQVLLAGIDDAVPSARSSSTTCRPATAWSPPGPGSAASCCRTRAGSTPRPSASAGSCRLLRTTARAFFRLCGAAGPLRRAVFSD